MASSNKDQTDFATPRTPADELIAGIIEDLLGIERVGIHGSFFHLGETSELATGLIAQLREIFRVELTESDIFEFPTINELVNTLARTWGGREIIDEIAWTFMQVERLSDREVALMLQSKIAEGLDYREAVNESNRPEPEAPDKRKRLFELLLELTGITFQSDGMLRPVSETHSSES